MHPRYSALVSIFDEQIRSLLLRPSSTDFTLDVVQAFLLSIQWPALDFDDSGTGGREAPPRTRFNDAYAWLLIGIAIRFAKHIGLDGCAKVDYSAQGVGEEELARMRVWLNLISIDRQYVRCRTPSTALLPLPIGLTLTPFSLTLTAGLPSTLEPPPTNVIRAFGSHPLAQPGDLKLAGLSELVAIVQRAAISCGDVSLRNLDVISLQVANAELDEWDKRWSLVLGSSGCAFVAAITFFMPHCARRGAASYAMATGSCSVEYLLSRHVN